MVLANPGPRAVSNEITKVPRRLGPAVCVLLPGEDSALGKLDQRVLHVPEERVIDWCIRYWERARKAGIPVAADFADFYRDFEWMGAQRQIKVLGIFARLSYRDGKDGYLRDQPLVMRYLQETCARYRELAPLARLLDELEPVEKKAGYTF